MIRPIVCLAALTLVACGDEPTPRIGSVCSDREDCEVELAEYCSKVFICVRACSASSCSDGSRCVQIGSRSVCLRECSRQSDCNKHEECTTSYSALWRVCTLENPLAIEGPWSYD